LKSIYKKERKEIEFEIIIKYRRNIYKLCGVKIFVVVFLSDVIVLEVLENSVGVSIRLDDLDHQLTLIKGDFLSISGV